MTETSDSNQNQQVDPDSVYDWFWQAPPSGPQDHANASQTTVMDNAAPQSQTGLDGVLFGGDAPGGPQAPVGGVAGPAPALAPAGAPPLSEDPDAHLSDLVNMFPAIPPGTVKAVLLEAGSFDRALEFLLEMGCDAGDAGGAPYAGHHDAMADTAAFTPDSTHIPMPLPIAGPSHHHPNHSGTAPTALLNDFGVLSLEQRTLLPPPPSWPAPAPASSSVPAPTLEGTQQGAYTENGVIAGAPGALGSPYDTTLGLPNQKQSVPRRLLFPLALAAMAEDPRSLGALSLVGFSIMFVDWPRALRLHKALSGARKPMRKAAFLEHLTLWYFLPEDQRPEVWTLRVDFRFGAPTLCEALRNLPDFAPVTTGPYSYLINHLSSGLALYSEDEGGTDDEGEEGAPSRPAVPSPAPIVSLIEAPANETVPLTRADPGTKHESIPSASQSDMGHASMPDSLMVPVPVPVPVPRPIDPSDDPPVPVPIPKPLSLLAPEAPTLEQVTSQASGHPQPQPLGREGSRARTVSGSPPPVTPKGSAEEAEEALRSATALLLRRIDGQSSLLVARPIPWFTAAEAALSRALRTLGAARGSHRTCLALVRLLEAAWTACCEAALASGRSGDTSAAGAALSDRIARADSYVDRFSCAPLKVALWFQGMDRALVARGIRRILRAATAVSRSDAVSDELRRCADAALASLALDLGSLAAASPALESHPDFYSLSMTVGGRLTVWERAELLEALQGRLAGLPGALPDIAARLSAAVAAMQGGDAEVALDELRAAAAAAAALEGTGPDEEEDESDDEWAGQCGPGSGSGARSARRSGFVSDTRGSPAPDLEDTGPLPPVPVPVPIPSPMAVAELEGAPPEPAAVPTPVPVPIPLPAPLEVDASGPPSPEASAALFPAAHDAPGAQHEPEYEPEAPAPVPVPIPLTVGDLCFPYSEPPEPLIPTPAAAPPPPPPRAAGPGSRGSPSADASAEMSAEFQMEYEALIRELEAAQPSSLLDEEQRRFEEAAEELQGMFPNLSLDVVASALLEHGCDLSAAADALAAGGGAMYDSAPFASQEDLQGYWAEAEAEEARARAQQDASSEAMLGLLPASTIEAQRKALEAAAVARANAAAASVSATPSPSSAGPGDLDLSEVASRLRRLGLSEAEVQAQLAALHGQADSISATYSSGVPWSIQPTPEMRRAEKKLAALFVDASPVAVRTAIEAAAGDVRAARSFLIEQGLRLRNPLEPGPQAAAPAMAREGSARSTGRTPQKTPPRSPPSRPYKHKSIGYDLQAGASNPLSFYQDPTLFPQLGAPQMQGQGPEGPVGREDRRPQPIDLGAFLPGPSHGFQPGFWPPPPGDSGPHGYSTHQGPHPPGLTWQQQQQFNQFNQYNQFPGAPPYSAPSQGPRPRQAANSHARYQAEYRRDQAALEELKEQISALHAAGTECFSLGDTRRGMALREKAREMMEQWREMKAGAARRRAQLFNSQFMSDNHCRIDLHTLSVDEALSEVRRSVDHYLGPTNSVTMNFTFITGQGRHSEGSVARVRPAVVDMLRGLGLEPRVDPINPGEVRVRVGPAVGAE